MLIKTKKTWMGIVLTEQIMDTETGDKTIRYVGKVEEANGKEAICNEDVNRQLPQGKEAGA